MGDEAGAKGEVELSADERAEIDGMYLRLANSTLYELLGAPPEADRRAIRDRYFALSQRFHPDAWFGRNLGAWKARTEEIFREVTRAYDILSNRNQRAEYDASIGVVSAPKPSPGAEAASAEASGKRAESPRAADPVPPIDPRAPVLPMGRAESRAAAASAAQALGQQPERSLANDTGPQPTMRSGSAPAMPVVDHAAAVRAARETLARKFRHSSGTIRAVRPPTTVVEPRRPDGAAPTSNALASFEVGRLARDEQERRSRLAQFVRAADESAKRKDFIGASNSLAVALSMAPDDPELKTRAEEAARLAAAVLSERYSEQARQYERVGKWDDASACWQKAVAGRPNDPEMLVPAAGAMLRAGKELGRAAEFARRATQAAPKALEAFVVLAEIYLAGKLKASATAAIDAASKLDPTSPVVKDLQARLKG